MPFSRYFVFDPAYLSISMAPVRTSEISDVDTGLVVDDFRVGYTFAVLADEDRLCVSGMTVRLWAEYSPHRKVLEYQCEILTAFSGNRLIETCRPTDVIRVPRAEIPTSVAEDLAAKFPYAKSAAPVGVLVLAVPDSVVETWPRVMLLAREYAFSAFVKGHRIPFTIMDRMRFPTTSFGEEIVQLPCECPGLTLSHRTTHIRSLKDFNVPVRTRAREAVRAVLHPLNLL